MEKNYKEIVAPIGSLNRTIERLHSYNEPVCCNFNGVIIYSDQDADTIYEAVLGKTKAEFTADVETTMRKYRASKNAHQAAIPKLTKEWLEKGKEILDNKYLPLWAEIVPVRLNDLYEGMELGAALEVIKALNEGFNFFIVENIIDHQGHSGVSGSLVLNMINKLCDRGEDFVKYYHAVKEVKNLQSKVNRLKGL